MKEWLLAFGGRGSMAMAAVSVPAQAHGNFQPAKEAQGQQANNPAMQGRRAAVGSIMETNDINFKGDNAKRRLVKIRNPEGQSLVINVGDATRVPADQLKKSNRIVAAAKKPALMEDRRCTASISATCEKQTPWASAPVDAPEESPDEYFLRSAGSD